MCGYSNSGELQPHIKRIVGSHGHAFTSNQCGCTYFRCACFTAGWATGGHFIVNVRPYVAS